MCFHNLNYYKIGFHLNSLKNWFWICTVYCYWKNSSIIYNFFSSLKAPFSISKELLILIFNVDNLNAWKFGKKSIECTVQLDSFIEIVFNILKTVSFTEKGKTICFQQAWTNLVNQKLET